MNTKWMLTPFIISGAMGLGDAIAQPCKIPLQLVNEGTTTKPVYKLGINVGLGGGAPRLYEFDTGGAGFWAGYNGNLPSASQWWGQVDTLSTGNMTIQYTSGNEYTANLVGTQVSLYKPGAASSTGPVCSTPGPVQISQITQYQNANPNKQASVQSWDAALAKGKAPLEGHFWGDFGAALHPAMNTSGSQGVYTVLDQFKTGSYHNGFIVHTGPLTRKPKPAPYVQIGLTAQDIVSFPYRISMNEVCGVSSTASGCPLPGTFSNTPVATFGEAQFQADVTVNGKKTNPSSQLLSSIGVTIDSGAPLATIWQYGANAVDQQYLKNPKPISGTSIPTYSGKFKTGESVTISTAKTLDGNPFSTTQSESLTPLYSRIEAGMHSSGQPNAGTPYINTGVLFFSNWDVMFDVDAGVIGFKPAPPQPLYGTKTVTIPVYNVTNGKFTGSPAIDVAFMTGNSLGKSSRFTMDTGSTSVVVTTDVWNPPADAVSLGPGQMFYSSSGTYLKGNWYQATLRLGTDNQNALTSVPVLVVNKITCKTTGARDCKPNDNPTGTRMMGVGFAREVGSQAVNYDGNVASIPANNAMLHIKSINGEPVTASAPQFPGSPATVGNLTSGYILTTKGVTIGLTAANTAKFKLVPLSWINMMDGTGTNTNWADWGPIPVTLNLNGKAGTGYVLNDTGIQYMMAKPVNGAPYQTDKSCDFGTFTSTDCLASGTKIAINIGNAARYAFKVGQTTKAPAAMPPFAIYDGEGTDVFVNTGYYFFNQFAYVYDYVNGYVGYRDMTAK